MWFCKGIGLIQFLTLLIATLIAGAASAAEPSEILKCSAIKDSVKRLECFDGLASLQQSEADAAAEISFGDLPAKENWVTSISQSKVDDSTTVILSAESQNIVSGRFNKTARPRLILRCMENATSAYINFDGLHMAEIQGYGRVTFRVDKKKAVTKSTDVSTDNKALGFWSGGGAIPFIKSLFGGSELLVQATPFSDSAVTFSLDISGLEEAVQPLRKACNW